MRFAEKDFQKEVESFGFLFVYAHGSQVSQTARPDSDLDVALMPPRPWSFDFFAQKAESLCRLIAEVKGLPSDSVHYQDLRSCPNYFRYRVLTNGVLLGVTEPTVLAQFQASTYCQAWDEEIYLKPILESFNKRVQSQGYAS